MITDTQLTTCVPSEELNTLTKDRHEAQCLLSDSENQPVLSLDKSPLHFACRQGDISYVRQVTDIEDHIQTKATWEGLQMTPFQCALYTYTFSGEEGPVDNGDLNLVMRYLLDRGADPNSPVPGMPQTTPLLLACSGNNLRLALSLVAHGCDVNVQDANASSPLMLLLQHTKSKGTESLSRTVAKEMLERGADPNWLARDSKEWHGKPCLHLAAACGASHFELLLEYGADVNIRDTDGNTVLDLLAKTYSDFKGLRSTNCPTHEDKILYRLLKKPKELEFDRVWGTKALCILHLAARVSTPFNVPFIEKLVTKRPDVIKFINVPTTEGLTPIFECIALRTPANFQDAMVLLEHNATINYVYSSTNKTILYKIIKKCCFLHLWEISEPKSSFVLSVVEAILNKGLLSQVFYKIQWNSLEDGSEAWYAKPIFGIREAWCHCFEKLLNRSVQGNNRLQDITRAVLDQDIHLFVPRSNLLSIHDNINKEYDAVTPAFLNYLNTRLDVDFCQSVISLKRLCRKALREYISTTYGEALIPFDMKVVFTKVPLPKLLQQYLMVKFCSECSADVDLS